MKKIMFNDKYGLTTAVLEGRKTMTRRVISEMIGREYKKLPQVQEDCNDGSFLVFKDADDLEPVILYPKYKVGEIMAVAQRYKDVRDIIGDGPHDGKFLKFMEGWNNKMFVRADLMPHRIRITGIKVERLRDITSEDCINEGIEARVTGCHTFYYIHGEERPYNFPKQAFSALIDKVSGKGTWASNPYCFFYTFELIK